MEVAQGSHQGSISTSQETSVVHMVAQLEKKVKRVWSQYKEMGKLYQLCPLGPGTQ